jgi:type IV pilus assembly protein PilM
MVEKLMVAVRGAGLRPEGVDLSAFALIRSLHRPGAHEGRVLYLNVSGLTNMAIADGIDCRFTRVAAGGLESIATAIAERNAIPLEKARDLLAAVDLSPELVAPVTPEPAAPPAAEVHEAPAAEQGDPTAVVASAAVVSPLAEQDAMDHTTEVQPLRPAEPSAPREPEIDVRPVLVAGVREIASEVRNSLDFHRSQGGGDEVSTVVLSGAALQIAGFAEALRGELSVPVVTQTVTIGDAGAAGSVSPELLAVAAGLAVEEAPR